MLRESALEASKAYSNADYHLESKEFAKKAKREFLSDIEEYCDICVVTEIDPESADISCDGMQFHVKMGDHGALEIYLTRECKGCHERVARFVTYTDASNKLRSVGTILEKPELFFKHKCSKNGGIEFVE